LIPSNSILNLSEEQFEKLPIAERSAKATEINSQLSELKKRAAAEEIAGADAEKKQDFDRARECFDSLKRTGSALDTDDAMFIVRLVGQAMEIKALAELAKLPEENETPPPATSSPISPSTNGVPSVTGAESRELEGDVGRLYHAIVYTQTSAEAPKLGPTSYQFIADMSNTQFPVTSSLVSLPAGSAWGTNPVAVATPNSLFGAHYLFVQGFKSEADLMANFPNGSYVFNVQSGGSGAAAYKVPVGFKGSVPYPTIAPVITNTTWDSGSLVLDPASAVINFTNYPGATLTWEIFIPGRTYIMSAGGGGTSMGSLGLSGLLDYGQTYEAQLRFINRDMSSAVNDPNLPKDYGYSTMVAQIVEFKIRTPAGHASAALP
jgi:hypothetical protein